MARKPPNLKIERYYAIAAWIMWFLAFAGTTALVAKSSYIHNDCGIYRGASEQWWAGEGIYANNRGIDGFLYFPQFAVIYSPFAALDYPIGDIAWRAVGLALFVAGVWRVSRLISFERRYYIFALATIGTLMPSLASLRNGQANLHIAGLMLQVVAEIYLHRWTRAAIWLTLGIIAKPIMVVMALLSAAIYRPIIPRLAIGVILALVMPFAFQHPHYVASQFHDYVAVMNISSNPPDLFCNIRGLFGKMGWVMSHGTFNGIATIAAAATLCFCLLAERRWPEPMRVYFLLAFAACYLMLFNPRTESNSYVILSPIVAIPAAVLISLRHRAIVGASLYFFTFLLICDGWAYKATENWLKPLTGLIILAILICFLFKFPRLAQVAESRKPKLAELQSAN